MKLARASILTAIFLIFFAIFTYLSFKTMTSVSFYDFDEAHRAETAKEMKEYKSFFVPLTGSSFDRVEQLKIPARENPDLNLYYHLERPPLIYDLMILSTTLFGSSEWAYRLPSFILGISIFAAFLFFARKEDNKNIFGVSTGLLVLFTSADLWLSSQYAQMDTGISFFLFLALLTLISYLKNKRFFIIMLSGAFYGLALLSKLQPAVIFIFPILFLLVIRKLQFKDLLKFLSGFVLVFGPWFLYLVLRFGTKEVVDIAAGFALTSASIIDIHHKAPIFWYARWWWDSLRPGWVLFLSFLLYDLTSFNLNLKKLTLLSFSLLGFLAFSIPTNKLWWYVLPLIPPVAYYICMSSGDYLKKHPKRLVNLSIILILASLPAFLGSSNRVAVAYGIILTYCSFLILKSEVSLAVAGRKISKEILFVLSVITSLTIFYTNFPEIIPYHRNTKEVALVYKNLPGQKCLFIGDMPTEAALFYSDTKEILPIQVKNHTPVFLNCENNYLITPDDYNEGELIIRRGNIRLYKLLK